MIEDKLDAAAVRCFVEVAAALDIKTVAEYVKSEEMLARVKTLGIDFAQGYLLHKPKPIESVLSSVKLSNKRVARKKRRNQVLLYGTSNTTSVV